MISDRERRGVAEELRLMCECEIPTGDMYALLDETDRDHQACAIALYGAIGFAMNGAPSVRQAILRLADLIDRPTCENIADQYDGSNFECSKCGERWELTCGSPADNHLNYCPRCGSKVVS